MHRRRFLQVIKFSLNTVFVVFTSALTRAIVTLLSHASCLVDADSRESLWMLLDLAEDEAEGGGGSQSSAGEIFTLFCSSL